MIPVVLPTYGRADVAFERGEGAYVWSSDGRRFLDFGAGVAVTNLGHCHPRLVAALTAQAGKLWHTSNHYRIDGQERVAAKLVANTFADTVFFCNSGAEANECASRWRGGAFRPRRRRRDQIVCATGATVAAPWAPSPRRGKNTWKASSRACPASSMCRSAA